MLASAAVKTAYLEMQPAFERATGHRLDTVWIPTSEMAKRVGSGEAVDLVTPQRLCPACTAEID